MTMVVVMMMMMMMMMMMVVVVVVMYEDDGNDDFEYDYNKKQDNRDNGAAAAAVASEHCHYDFTLYHVYHHHGYHVAHKLQVFGTLHDVDDRGWVGAERINKFFAWSIYSTWRWLLQRTSFGIPGDTFFETHRLSQRLSRTRMFEA